MAESVYVLCAVTSFICAGLLLRQYRSSRNRLLLWCSVCFLGLALNNSMLLLDLVVFPNVDLSLLRISTGFLAMMVLVYGLIWDSK